jgi:hypothetical protein
MLSVLETKARCLSKKEVKRKVAVGGEGLNNRWLSGLTVRVSFLGRVAQVQLAVCTNSNNCYS